MNDDELFDLVRDKVLSMIPEDNPRVPALYYRMPQQQSINKEPFKENQIFLRIIALYRNYRSPYWITPEEIKKHKAEINPEEKPFQIQTKDNSEKTLIYNTDQISNLSLDISEGYFTPLQIVPIEKADKIITNYLNRPNIEYTYPIDEPKYYYLEDKIVFPSAERFTSMSNFYSVLFHELAHSTGNVIRLGRGNPYPMTKKGKAFEEIIAELTSAYLCAKVDILDDVIEHSANYIKHFLNELHQDSFLYYLAADKAKNAAHYISFIY